MATELSGKEAQQLVESVSSLYRGPGGACALLKDGKVIGQHVWGYADLEKRIPMAADTIFPICSISKQFVCLVLAKILQEPGMAAKADAVMREMLPSSLSSNKDLTIERLSHMQSGIRDYWALTVLWGSQLDGVFTLAKDAPAALQRLGSFHFEPGTQYSYSNVNFYILGTIVEKLTGQPLEEALKQHVFNRASMPTAKLHPDTNDRPSPIIGYEGLEEGGFFPALNRIEWAGDAGIVASLNDMIAYEQYLNQQYADSNSMYSKNATPVEFINGAPAFYGWGFNHSDIARRNTLGHGGGLRGFRLQRRHMPNAHLSAIVMFNHDADAEAAARYLLERGLRMQEAETGELTPGQGWEGAYLDPETELAITVTPGQKNGEIMINNSFHAEKVKCTEPFKASSRSMTATLSDKTLTLHRPRENRTITAQRLQPSSTVDSSALTGSYRSDEIDSTFHVTGSAKMLYGSFDGYLGKGPAHLMRYLGEAQAGESVWYLTCQRALDAHAPGYWTVVFKRDGDGKVVGAGVGNWLARKVLYVRA